jgi:hypothetical protein
MHLEPFTYTAERGREMIEISEPLSGSELGYRTRHDILLRGKRIGYVDVAYLQKSEVKAFRRTKRKLRVGQPFGVRLYIDAVQGGTAADDLGHEGLVDLVNAVMAKFKGLDGRDLYLLELGKNGKTALGRASNLAARQ